ncbi:hypothetical protein, partial [Hydrogenophaga sp.]|uniref:hypothetical protein n=1 Tax=Hydrogenophaga sp. TaxID=1904254 RepID=UPI00356ABF19
MPNTPLLSVVDGLDASGIHREVWPSRSPHLVLARARVPGPVQAVAAVPHFRISCNVGPPYAFHVAGQHSAQPFTCRKHALQIIPPGLAMTQQASWPLPAGRQRKPVLLAT